MASDSSISTEIAALKQKVKEIIGEVNSLKTQLEKREITLEQFRGKKEFLENELRGLLQQISKFKEEGPKEIKRDAIIAEEANKLMYDFQTEFSEYISKPKVYLSVSIVDHFIFEVDFTNYPEKPILMSPPFIEKLFEEPFDTKISILTNWSPQNPPHITEIFYEIEQIFLKIFQLEKIEGFNLNRERIQKILQRRELLASAEYEIGYKNIQRAIELYQKVIQLSYELEDFERADKYSKIIAQLKNQPEKTTENNSNI